MGTPREILTDVALLLAGNILVAIAVNGLLLPMKFVSGGFIGMSMVIQYISPIMSVGLLYVLLNIPLYVLGFRFVGRRFFVWSIIGAAILSLALQYVTIPPLPVHDKIPAALLAGILAGLGSGLVLRSRGSGGGADILSVILLERFSVRLGTTLLAFNSLILLGAAIFFSLEGVLYTLVYLYVSSQIMNLVVTGLSQRRAVFIVSDKWREISRSIIDQIQRGATQIPAWGAFSGRPERMLYTVVAIKELPRLKSLVRKIDPLAFLVAMDTLEVIGHRIGNQPHWSDSPKP